MWRHFVEFCKACAKIILLALNGFCIVIALCTLGFAVVDTRILKQYGHENASGTLVADIILIAASLLLVAVAVFGCVGAIKECAKTLYLYVGLLMILVVLEMLIGIGVAIQRYGLEFRVTDWMRDDFFRNVSDEDISLHNKVWDDLQARYECCGLNGPDDYTATQREISLSCCPSAFRARTTLAQTQLHRACIESYSYYNDGCEDAVLEVLREAADWLLGVAVTSFWFEAACMLLAAWVANNLKNSVEVYKHTVKY